MSTFSEILNNLKEEKNIKEQGEVNQPMQKMQTKQALYLRQLMKPELFITC